MNASRKWELGRFPDNQLVSHLYFKIKYFLGQEDAANSEGGAGNASEGKGRAGDCGKKEGSFDDAALPTRRAGGGQRPVDPFPYDREAAVVRICKNLRNHEPTKYAFLAGLYPSKRDPQLKTLKELPLSGRQPNLSLNYVKQLRLGNCLFEKSSEAVGA